VQNDRLSEPSLSSTPILETARLALYRLSVDDAPFILELLNDPGFVRFIGDRGVRTLEDARQYVLTGPVASYQQHGFGLWRVDRQSDRKPIGMCGLLKRDTLSYVDIGFAYLPAYRGQGYAYEAADAVMHYASRALGLRRVAGVARPDNAASIALLEKLGMRSEGTARIVPDGPEDRLFVGATRP
jgi:RimJ/RimL family protein N-acetyltransferase